MMIQTATLTRFRLDPIPEATSRFQSLVHQIEIRLHTSPYLSLRQVTCSWWQGRLVVRGRVPTFYVKQVMQSIVRSICESTEIIDEVEVAGRFAISSLPARPR